MSGVDVKFNIHCWRSATGLQHKQWNVSVDVEKVRSVQKKVDKFQLSEPPTPPTVPDMEGASKQEQASRSE